MKVQLELPADLEAALHPNPERHVLESVLLQMIRRNVISVARAGEILSLNRAEAIIWYTSEGFVYPEFTPEEWADELKQVQHLRR